MTPPRSFLPIFAAFAASAASALTACGDDNSQGDDDVDAASDVDAAPELDAGIDAPPFVAPTPIAVTLSATGPDQLMAAVAVPGGTGYYAAGFAAATAAGDRIVTVAKLTAAGALDTTWAGGDGIAPTTLVFAGGPDEIDLGLQPDGKIIVTATVANGTAGDRDIAVTRLNSDGTVDSSFGGNNDGVRVLDLTTGSVFTGGTANHDRPRGLAVDATGRIVIHAVVRRMTAGAPPTPEADTDFAVVRLTPAGALDTTYGGGDGYFTLDILSSFATPRGVHVQADGKVIAGGYANSTATNSVQAVLYRVNADGAALDTTFATQGLFHEVVLQIQTEIYGFAVHATHLVTAGYGRNTGDTNDWVSMRFALADGARDTAFGGATNGAVVVDPSGLMLGDNCRNALALPGGRTLLLGSSGSGVPAQDAAFVVLTATGQLDTGFGDGSHVFPFGSNRGDQLWAGAVNGQSALLVGWSGVATQSDTDNDDAFAVILPLP